MMINELRFQNPLRLSAIALKIFVSLSLRV